MKRALILATVLIFLALSAQARALDGGELKRVDALLSLLSSRTDVTFVRNEKEYPVDKAVSHLRSKLKRAGSRIKTAEEFVDHLASKSSMSGKPYQVILPGGEKVDAGVFFHELLREVDGKRK
ncbi:MAG: DUF5329 family protein [Deltaproteobacteria bacterium]|jgi:hypothetical protein|nr:DUF5329 family protein [Deltaproteobacteria bacterium]